MIRRLHIWLWGIVSELEYHLYPWKGAPEVHEHEEYQPKQYKNDTFNDDWLRSQEERINRLQDEMIYVQRELHKLQNNKNNF